MINYAVIMAGGVGTRFWPKGNSKVPKQFLKITDDDDTLLQLAYKRLDGVFKNTNIFVVTNVIYKQEVKQVSAQSKCTCSSSRSSDRKCR